jgi:NAD(P)-dependent dehydrogenase (short-subunit alcohol dehydrogenase family)
VADLAGRTAVVTGASRGIGRAIAARFVSSGARVVVTGRTAETLDAAVAELGGPGVALGVAGNVRDPEHQAETVERALTAFGSIDVLVNNTGINPVYGPMVDLSIDAARKVVEVNVLAALSWVQQVHRAWMGEHGGTVVNVSSMSALRPARGIGLYGGSKAMLTHLTQQLALELAPLVRVNAVAPAVVKTDFALAMYDGREPEMASAYPLGRLGLPDDIAAAVAFLASNDSAWTTGQCLVVDGGLSLTGGAE